MVPGVASAQLGVKLPRESMWCERQRAKCKSSEGQKRKGFARRPDEQSSMSRPGLIRRGFGFFPPRHFYYPTPVATPPPSLYSKSPYPQLAFNAPQPHLWNPCLCLSSIRSPEESGRDAELEAKGMLLQKLFFLKHSKKQMALQSTGIALGWKFKMH